MLTLSPDLKVQVTLAIFRLSGNIPCWIETLKTWNSIFFKLSYSSIIILLFKTSNPGALFVLNFWMLPQIDQILTPRIAFFHYDMSKSLEILFQCSEFFYQFWSKRSKKVVEFFSSVLWILYSGFTNFNYSGREIWFCFLLSSYFFHDLPCPLRMLLRLADVLRFG